MNKERFKRYLETGANITALGVIASVTLSAFTRSRRKEILERDNYQCVHCGRSKNLEASHVDHTKDDGYNDLSRGLTEDTRCHYLRHLNYRDFPEDIGLSVEHNDSAIKSLYKRIPKDLINSVPEPDCSDEEMQQWNEWIYGDPDYWKHYDNSDPYVIENWPINTDINIKVDLGASKRRRI